MVEQEKKGDAAPFPWEPWAVLIALVVFGLLGFLGVLSPNPKGPSAADVSPGIAAPAGSAGTQ
jgi:hypothetical protein